MAQSLTEYQSLSVRTADAIARYLPGMRSDPFAFKRMLTSFLLHVEDPRSDNYRDCLKYGQAKDRERAEAHEAERLEAEAYRRGIAAGLTGDALKAYVAAKGKPKDRPAAFRHGRHTKPLDQEKAADKAIKARRHRGSPKAKPSQEAA